MINIKLVASSTVGVPELASFSAKVCYQAEEPEIGKVLDIESALFKTGHHTTLQHSFFTFFIEGVAVSDVTLGLHLANPFYNTSQRSGRFCAAMFVCPDYEKIGQYIKTYWPELSEEQFSLAINFIKSGIEIYQDNLSRATEVAKELIRKERPKATEKYIDQNAPKFAQEQLRNFIPTIFPTALVYTINFSALIALYRSACTPVLRSLTQKMADIVLEKYPTFDYAFKRDTGDCDYKIPFLFGSGRILEKPEVFVLSLGDESRYVAPSSEDVHPVDLLRFLPRFMNNNVEEIKTRVCVSLATMGQDQRHRTIDRSEVVFDGSFYLPPIPKYLGMEEKATEILSKWKELYAHLPHTLVQGLSPYGVMARYRKSASYNAATHELGKRLCWCAQEEIFHLALGLREEIICISGESPLLKMFPPACVRSGKCGEGSRYCGRDMKAECFSERMV